MQILDILILLELIHLGKLEKQILLNQKYLSSLLKVAQGQVKNIEIFGDNWPTKDGTPTRDYIHIMDLASAHLKVLEFLQVNSPQFLNINIGTGIGTTVLDLIKIFEKVNNIEIPYIISSRRKGDYGTVIANIDLASKILDWEPKYQLRYVNMDGTGR